MDLPEDREAETLASWLRAQPQTQIVIRDRSLYAAQQFPERKVHYIPSRLDPYLPYLEQRAGEECVKAQQLLRLRVLYSP